MYNVVWQGSEPNFITYSSSGSGVFPFGKETHSSVYFNSSIPSLSSISRIELYSLDGFIDFNYVPDLYDYYLLGTFGYPDGDINPVNCYLFTADLNGSNNLGVYLTDFSYYLHTDNDSRGFTFFGKFPEISSFDNTSIQGFSIATDSTSDFLSAGVVYFDGLIIAVDKSVSSTSDALTEIILRLDQVNSNLVSGAAGIQSVIQSQTQHDQQLWDDTYNPDQSEAEETIAGVGREYVTLLEEGLGAVTYFEQVTTAVIDIFYNPNLGDPLIPFPGFNISVGGTTSTVWEPMTVNLAEVLEPFGPLLTAVRFANLFMVWSALLGYFTKVFNEILRR